jgi:hypothetical protein
MEPTQPSVVDRDELPPLTRLTRNGFVAGLLYNKWVCKCLLIYGILTKGGCETDSAE